MAYSLSAEQDFILASQNNPDKIRFTIIPGKLFVSILERSHTIGTWDSSEIFSPGRGGLFYDSFKNSCPTIQHVMSDLKFRAWEKNQQSIQEGLEEKRQLEKEEVLRFLEKGGN